MRFVNPVAAALCAAVAVTASAQQYQTLDNPVGEFRPYDSDSGLLANQALAASTLFREDVRIDDAAWIRLYFDGTSLAPGSFVRIRSRLDGEVQVLDADALAMWGNTSAYFNGDALSVELVGGANTENNRLVIDQIAVEIPGIAAGGAGQCGICGGSDDRVPSNENWTSRLLPSGCTASVYSEDSCMVSAGHCVGGAMVVQFNVPASNENCSINNPPVADQFPATTIGSIDGGVGNDWSVLEPGTNNLGEKPYDRYADLRPIAAGPVGVGTAVVLTGYGVDLTCSRSQTQQTANGTICAVQGNFYTFGVDSRPGNSGSSLTANGEIIGIATHCTCCNVATRIDNLDFVAARAEICEIDPPGNDECTGAIPLTETITDFITSGATTSTPPLPGECDEGGGLAFDNDIWFTYTAEFPSVILNLCLDPLTFNGRMAVYEDNCGTLTLVGCSDDSCDLGPSVEFEGECDTTYLVRIGGSGDVAGYGRLIAASFGECVGSCPWDLDDDGGVGINDFLDLLAAWDTDPGGPPDFDGDGDVDTQDFQELLANWGPC